MVEYLAVLLNHGEVSRDRLIAYHSLFGNDEAVKGIYVGEEVLFRRRPLPNRMSKLTQLWQDGVYLGMRSVSRQVMVGVRGGVWRTCAVQRNRCSADAVDMVGCVCVCVCLGTYRRTTKKKPTARALACSWRRRCPTTAWRRARKPAAVESALGRMDIMRADLERRDALAAERGLPTVFATGVRVPPAP